MSYSKATFKIENEAKEKIEKLIEQKLFQSKSEFYRLAINRFLKDIESYEEKKTKTKKEALKRTDLKIEEGIKDIIKFTDELF